MQNEPIEVTLKVTAVMPHTLYPFPYNKTDY